MERGWGAHSHKLLRIPRRTQLSGLLSLGEQLLGSVWAQWFAGLCRQTMQTPHQQPECADGRIPHSSEFT